MDTGPQWTVDQIRAALQRGPHLSAMKPEAMAAFREEVASKLEQKQVKILEWDKIKHDLPKELKLSPMAQIPHKSSASEPCWTYHLMSRRKVKWLREL